MLLILLAILPMIFAAGFFAFNWGVDIYRNLENQTELMVNGIAERQLWSVENAQIVMAELSTRVDRWLPLQISECRKLLNEYFNRGSFVSLAILDEKGGAFCQLPTTSPVENLVEVDAVAQSLQNQSLGIGMLQTDPLTSRMILPFVVPIQDDFNHTRGYIYAGIPAELFQQLIVRSGIPAETETVFTDLSGTIVAIFPENPNLIGETDFTVEQKINNDELVNQGKFTTSGIDGVTRLFSYRVLTLEGQPFGIIRSGLPLENVNREFQKLLFTIGFLFIAVFLLSILLAYLISGRVLERRSEPLLNAAKKIARGDLAVRTQPRMKATADGLLELEKTFNQMAEALEEREKSHRKIEEALKESNEKLAAIIRTSPLAIIVENMEGRVIEWSPAATSIFGWTASEVNGKEMPVLSPDQESHFQAIRTRVLSGKTIQIQEIMCQTKDGREIPVGLSAALLRNTAGEAAGITYLFADLSEQKKALETVTETQQMLSVLMK
ncbi:MAG: PAS domain S-box protein, partial [Bellilinea sp.]